MAEASGSLSDSEIERIKIERQTDEYLLGLVLEQGKEASLSEIRTDFDRFLREFIKEMRRRKGRSTP